jgi:hypothetical protein
MSLTEIVIVYIYTNAYIIIFYIECQDWIGSLHLYIIFILGITKFVSLHAFIFTSRPLHRRFDTTYKTSPTSRLV